MDIIYVGIGIFLGLVVIIELLIYGASNLKSTQEAKIRKRFRKYTYVESTAGEGSIEKKRVVSDIPWLNALLLKIPVFGRLDNLVLQANTRYSLGFYLMLALLMGGIGTLGGLNLFTSDLFAFALGAGLVPLPFFYLMYCKRRRVKRFQAQFHESLEFVARALKAGHAFSSGMRLAADEFADPLGTEFDEALDEINFGVSVPEALKHMAQRVDCPEIRYFVVSVIIQRETGGNMAELMESLAKMIRDRYEFEGKVRILTAEGRMSGVMLISLPFLLLGYLKVSNPKFLQPLFTDPIGTFLLVTAGILMVIGALIMRKLVQIEV